MTHNVSCPINTKKAIVVGCGGGTYPQYNSNSSSTQTTSCVLNLVDTDVDFFVVTSYPTQLVASNTVSSSYSYGLSTHEVPLITNIVLPTGSSTVIGWAYNPSATFYCNYLQQYTASYNASAKTLSFSAYISRSSGQSYTVVAYKYED